MSCDEGSGPRSPQLDKGLLDAVPVDPTAALAERLDSDLWCLQLPLPMPRLRRINAYAVRAEDGWVLVDCGVSLAALDHALSLTPFGMGDLSGLLITHTHSDHSALAATLVEQVGLPLLRGRGRSTVTDPLRDPHISLPTRQASALREGVPTRNLDLMVDQRVADHGTEEVRAADCHLSPGDVIAGPGARWVTIPFPGHSAAQIGLWEPRRRILVSSDAVYPRAIPYLEWGSSSDPFQEYVSSLNRIGGLGVATLLPGHGRPDAAPSERIRLAHNVVDGLRDRVRRHVRDRDGTTAYDVVMAMVDGDTDPDRSQALLSTVLVVLEHLAATGTVYARVVDGTRRFWADRRGEDDR